MPDSPPSKIRPHPARAPGGGEGAAAPRAQGGDIPYAELCVTSNFTFLTGASHPEELVERAAELGHAAAAVADANTLAGIVRAHVAAKDAGIPLAVGCRIVLSEPEGVGVLVFATDRASYGRLCRMLTLGKRRAAKGKCLLTLDDLVAHQTGLLAVVLPGEPLEGDAAWALSLARLRGVFDDDRLSLALCREYGADDAARMRKIAAIAERCRVPLAAVNDAHYHIPRRRVVQDVVTCIRLGCTIEEAGLRLRPNAERHLKPPAEMARLFAEFPGAVARSAAVALRAAAFSLDELRYEYPEEVVPPGRTPIEHLTALTWQGAAERYPGGVPEKVTGLIRHELALIEELRYAPYFLTVHDLVVFSRGRGILCQGRGAAANSAVCYCLGVTSVDPERIGMLFERFVSRERNEPPDIDIDFEHERREEAIQYLYGKYGRERAALTAEVISYRGRSAIREVGKAMGLSLDCVDRLAKSLDWWDGGVIDRARIRELGINPDDPTLRMTVAIAREMLGFPRHLSQHVGGFVLTRGLLSETVPIENAAMQDRTVIEWDKDDIDALGILKVDVLGLGMLTCIRKAMGLINARAGHTGSSDGQAPEQSGPAGEVAGGVAGGATPDARGPRRGESCPAVGADARDGSTRRAAARFDRGGAPAPHACGGDRRLLGGRGAHRLHPREAQDAGGAGGDRSEPGCGAIAGDSDRSGERLAPVADQDVRAPARPAKLELHTIPPEDPATYDMICKADTVGVFQIESRAQMSMLPRLRPRCYYDLVIEVAIVRPGPIQGNMVHPYLRRRDGLEEIHYPDDAVRAVLGRTLGVPLFQEQAMQLAIVAAGFTPGEADQLRRAMAAWKRKGDLIYRFGQKLIAGMTARGYAREFAERCFEQIKGFSEYGFPESHAASFALLVYISSWLKCHHPAAFAAALLNSQPMGFYAPAQIVRDAKEHGVEVRPVDVNHSRWDCTLEDGDRGPALRLGMRLIRGLPESEALAIERAVARAGAFRTVAALRCASGVRVPALRRLAAADALGSMGLDRQRALWSIRGLTDEELPLFDALPGGARDADTEAAAAAGAALPAIPAATKISHDYASLGLSLKGHPMAFLRDWLDAKGAVSAAELRDELRAPSGRHAAAAGVVLVRQRPGTANGIVFMTIEDETGAMNLIIRPDVYREHRRALRASTAVLVRGRVERRGEVVHLLVRSARSLDGQLRNLDTRSRDFH